MHRGKKMKNMLKYQEIDQEIFKIESELNQDADRKNAIKFQNQLRDYQTKLIELNDKSRALGEDYDKLRVVFNQMAENLEVVNKNLAVKDEKKMDGLIEASEAITNNLLRLEKKLMAIVSDCTNVQNDYNNIMKSARTAKTNMEKYKDIYAGKKADAENKIAGLRSEQEKLEKSVDKTLLAKYKHQRTEKQNVFVAEIGGKCGGCRMEISAIKKSKLKDQGMIECENCGRFIYTK